MDEVGTAVARGPAAIQQDAYRRYARPVTSTSPVVGEAIRLNG